MPYKDLKYHISAYQKSFTSMQYTSAILRLLWNWGSYNV